MRRKDRITLDFGGARGLSLVASLLFSLFSGWFGLFFSPEITKGRQTFFIMWALFQSLYKNLDGLTIGLDRATLGSGRSSTFDEHHPRRLMTVCRLNRHMLQRKGTRDDGANRPYVDIYVKRLEQLARWGHESRDSDVSLRWPRRRTMKTPQEARGECYVMKTLSMSGKARKATTDDVVHIGLL